MSTVKEIEAAISQLSLPDLAELRSWFQNFDADEWDQQIEQDAASGKLDEFYQRLQKENQGSQVVPLDAFLNEK